MTDRNDPLQDAILEALDIASALDPEALGKPEKRPTLAWIISLAVRAHERKDEVVERLPHFGGPLGPIEPLSRPGGAEGFHER